MKLFGSFKLKRCVVLFLTVGLWLSVISCSDFNPPIDDPNYTETVTLFADEIAGPGGILIYNGEEITDEVEVPVNALVGVYKNDEAYLYHPALGNAELSLYNSRRAVGCFINDLITENDSMAEFAEQYSSIFDRAELLAEGGSPCQIVRLKDNKILSSGVKIFAEDKQHSTVTNLTKRWVATNVVAGEGPYFLPPRNDAPLATDMWTLLDQIINGNVMTGSSKKLTGTKVKVYGSVIRGVPAIWIMQPDYVIQYLQVMPDWMKRVVNVPVETTKPMTKEELDLQWTLLKAKAEEAMQDDEILFLHLNMLDFGHFTIEGLKAIIGIAMTNECEEIVLNSIILNIAETFWVGLLTMEPGQVISFAKESAKQITTALALCGLELITVTKPASKVMSLFFDVMCALAWVSDWQKGQTDTFKYNAFDCVQFGDAWPWNHAEIWTSNISFNYVTSDGDDLWGPLGMKLVVDDGHFEGNTFHGGFKTSFDPDAGGQPSFGNCQITIDPNTFDVTKFSANKTVTGQDGVGEITVEGKTIMLTKQYEWDGGIKSRWFECILKGPGACGVLTLLDTETKSGGYWSKNKKYSENQVQEILNCEQDSVIGIRIRKKFEDQL